MDPEMSRLLWRFVVLVMVGVIFFLDYKLGNARQKQIAALNRMVDAQQKIIALYQQQSGPPTTDELRLQQETEGILREAEQATEGAFYIHAPATGCPAGWTPVADLFKQADGSARPGCVLVKSNNGQFHGDYLLPGEGVSVSMAIPLPFAPRGNGKL
jgi:hypothetical protein